MALAIGIAAAVLFLGILIRSYVRRRPTALELERRRLAALHSRGKLGDASLLETDAGTLFYSYRVGGVEYTASQDISSLTQSLPADPAMLMGPVSIKYDPGNPANSMVLSSEWSGLRIQQLQKEKR